MLIRTTARLSIVDRLRVLWHGRVEIGYDVPRHLTEPPHAATVEKLLVAMSEGSRVYVKRVLPRRSGPPMCEQTAPDGARGEGRGE